MYVHKYSHKYINLDADGQSLGPVVEGSTRYNEMRRQLDIYREELFKSETQREDLKLKTEQQEKELSTYKNKMEELQVGNDNFVGSSFFK